MFRQNQEDYLRAIYRLWEKDRQNIRSIDISKELEISKGAVSEMLKKLVKHQYIKMAPYSNIIFTNKGLKKARELTCKHRIIEVFLKNILKISNKNIHQEAHKLEHAVSQEVIIKLAKFLKNPKVCPDGKNIPRINS